MPLINRFLASSSFIHSGYFYSTSSSPLLLRGAPEALQATVSEGLAHDPYVVSRVGFEPATLRTQGPELTTEPLRIAQLMPNFEK